jgi:hypothetical protein
VRNDPCRKSLSQHKGYLSTRAELSLSETALLFRGFAGTRLRYHLKLKNVLSHYNEPQEESEGRWDEDRLKHNLKGLVAFLNRNAKEEY